MEFVIVAVAVLTAAVIQETVIDRVRSRRDREPPSLRSMSESTDGHLTAPGPRG